MNENKLNTYDSLAESNTNIENDINIINVYSKCIQTLTENIDKYKNNPYILQRILNHIVLHLPVTLENEYKNHEKRNNRNQFLMTEQQSFIQLFMSKNKYFYLSNNNFFYEYDGERYLIIREDDMIHNLLSSISNGRTLLDWKYKTKNNIVKQIKERSLFGSIPESFTIQNVLNSIYPFIFKSKNSAKYFLTIIGDNILKKISNHIYLVSPKTKRMLYELDSIAVASIGNNSITHNFMSKYHEKHSYENCRLIQINETFSPCLWRELLKRIGLDLLCVAVHYSNRYKNSDQFIEDHTDEEHKQYTYYLKNSSQSSIVNDFCDKYIIEANIESASSTPIKETVTTRRIEWKNLHFVWKQFLSKSNLINILYSNTLKNLLREKYNYDENSDSFIGITSKYLPVHIDFIKFWENTITINNSVNCESQPDYEMDFELDELYSIYKLWIKNTDTLITNSNIGNINEENILKILKHFFPDVEIVEDKYVLHIRCSLWDKIKDIDSAMESLIRPLKEDSSKEPILSFDDAYNFYYKYCNLNSYPFIAGKGYFEKYIHSKFTHCILYDKIIHLGMSC